MEINRFEFNNSVNIVALGDIHYGDNQADRVMFKRVVDRIQNEENTYAIITGDLLNVGIADSVTGSYGSMTLGEELDIMCEILKPAAHKILGSVSSNHHARLERRTGMSLDKEVSERVGIKHLGHIGMFNIVVGNNCYYFAVHHGAGGGRTMGAKANELARLQEVVPGCDIYLQGHTHTFQHYLSRSYYVNRRKGKISELDSHFVTTGHFLNYESSYAAEQKLRPSAKGSAMIQLGDAKSGSVGKKSVIVSLIDG